MFRPRLFCRQEQIMALITCLQLAGQTKDSSIQIEEVLVYPVGKSISRLQVNASIKLSWCLLQLAAPTTDSAISLKKLLIQL